MSNVYVLFLLALVAGAMMPTQAAINNKLAGFIESPVSAAFISFLVGTVALLVYLLLAGIPLAGLSNVRQANPLLLIGGLLGAAFVTVSIMLVPRLGVATTFSLLIAGQMLLTLVLDHFGFLGLPVRAVSLVRVAGILLIAAGVVLIRRF